jgi:hypothetical protein
MLIPAPFPLKQHQKSNFGTKSTGHQSLTAKKDPDLRTLQDFAGLGSFLALSTS